MPPDARRTSLAIFAASMLFAWSNRFVQDDAYISFRYARNLAEGHGLVFNPGERVEGYSNFLWVLLLAGWEWLGVDLALASQAMGLLCFAGTLAVTFTLARRLTRSWERGALAMGLLGANATFAAYATGGLATQLQALLFVACFERVDAITRRDELSHGPILALSLMLAAAQLTRPDSGLMVLAIFAALLWLEQRRDTWRVRASHLAALLAPSGAIVGAWLAWKYQYYGELLPNTYHAKAAASSMWGRGLMYLARFAWEYWLWLALPLALVWREQPARWPPTLRAALAFVAAWLLYVIKIGGGFMEFRFLVPVWPLLCVAFAVVVFDWVENTRHRAVIVGALVAGSLVHLLTFTGVERRVLSFHDLGRYPPIFTEVGRAIDAGLAGADDVLIATPALGGVGYGSRQPVLDVYGLTDHWIARHGRWNPDEASGHQRTVPFSHVLERGVHLWTGDPVIRPDAEGFADSYPGNFALEHFRVSPEKLPAGARVLRIPLSEDHHLLLLQLASHPAIEAAVRRGDWQAAALVDE